MSVERRTLSLFDLVCLGVNAIVGSGIYAFPGILFGLLGPASFLAFAVCGGIALLVAFCFAEASGRFDRSGGPYVYAKAAFGGSAGYLVGWTCWTAALVSWAAVARALIPYLGHLAPPLGQGPAGTAAAVTMVIALGAINFVGVKPGAYTADLLTVAKLLPLFTLTATGLGAARLSRLRPFAPHGLSNLPRASFVAFFAFQGFEVVPVPAGESRDPQRNVPLAVLGSLCGATVLYMSIQVLAAATTSGLANAAEPLALMGETLLGAWGGQLVAAAAVISMVGFCAGVALASPRYLEPLAVDGFLPSGLAARHPRLGTPHRAIALTTGLSALLVVLLDFARLVDLSVLTVAVQYLSTCAAVPLLRRGRDAADRPRFHLPWGPAIPLLALGVVLALLAAQLLDQRHGPATYLSFAVMLGLGGLAALATRLLGKSTSAGDGR